MPPQQQQQQHHHSPTETAARLTFRRAPFFSSPVGLPSSTGQGGDGSVFSSISPMATLRGLLSGSTAAASAAAGATVSSSMTARRTQRSTHVGIADEESEDDGSSQGGNRDGSIIPVQMTLGRFNGGGGGGGRTRMVFTDQGWQVDDDLRRAYEHRIHELTEELARAEHAALASQSECKRLEGEKEDQGLLTFKNRLLVEMLAIAQLDEAAAREALGSERAKSEEYRKELERCYARMLGFGIDPEIQSIEARAGSASCSTGGARSPAKRRA